MYLKDSDTDSEPGSADLATIVTVERKSSNAVISRPRLVEKTFLVPEKPASTSARPHDHSARRTAADVRTSIPRAPPAGPLMLAGRVMGLPPRPKLPPGKGNVPNTAVYETPRVVPDVSMPL
jgi:hypothetical protein